MIKTLNTRRRLRKMIDKDSKYIFYASIGLLVMYHICAFFGTGAGFWHGFVITSTIIIMFTLYDISFYTTLSYHEQLYTRLNLESIKVMSREKKL
jgi:hypothetical protein